MSNEFQDARIEELERDLAAAQASNARLAADVEAMRRNNNEVHERLAAAQTRAHDLGNQVMVAWGERDEARAEAAALRKMVETVMAIPRMTDAQLEELKRNCLAAIDQARGAAHE